MGYEKHSIEGILIDERNRGEADKTLFFLTANKGILMLVAKGVRKDSSKLRASLSLFNLVDLEYIEGKEVNRLTGVQVIEEFKITNLAERKVVSNIVNFLLRVIIGEQNAEKTLDMFLEGLRYFSRYFPKVQPSGKLDMEVFEIVWLIKILITLGYWENGRYDIFSEENFQEVSEKKKAIVEEINKAIHNTQL